ncbi:MAG: hypothetical protein ABIQ39_13505, partial [Ilumatobacteraceae bacterium]
MLDTRAGLGANGNRNKVAPGVVLNLPISAAAAAGATSVVVNITATEADGPGWVKAWPCGTRTPPTSVLNFAPGRTTANAVVVQLGQGAICLSTYAPVHLVADVSGWFTGTTDFTGTAPNRITDTREANEPLRSGGPLQGGAERRIRVGGTAGVPP